MQQLQTALRYSREDLLAIKVINAKYNSKVMIYQLHFKIMEDHFTF